MAYNISFPGKTFLIGEYAVLEKAPAVLVNTKPRFYFFVTSGKCTNFFHSESPAGQWLKRYPSVSQSYHIESWDPHFGKGGFGLSSAQFNLAYLLWWILKGESPEKINLLKMWEDYGSLKFPGQKPSGVDIISQWMGELCLFTPNPFYACSIQWPFPDLDFFLIRTGIKLSTWEHLNQIQVGKKFSALSDLAEKAFTYVKNSNTEAFVATLKEYANCLEQQNLVHQKTLFFLNEIKKVKLIVAAKGCGALGAEVIAVFFHPKDKQTVRDILAQTEFGKSSHEDNVADENIMADSSHLSQGMMIHQSVDFHS